MAIISKTEVAIPLDPSVNAPNQLPLPVSYIDRTGASLSRSASPPREFVFPTIIEVTYFLNMCRQLRIPVDTQLCPTKAINLFNFCDLCWRHPLPGRKLCAHHASNNALQHEDGTQAAAARYKAGCRQQERFDKRVNEILSKEVLEFHKGSFTPVVLLPESGIAAWLSERRPAVWQLLGEQQQEIDDSNAVDALLRVLHNTDGLPSKARRICEQINEHLRAHPLLIWPMLIRAEGWHQSRNALREKWGGNRLNAGKRDAYVDLNGKFSSSSSFGSMISRCSINFSLDDIFNESKA